MSSTSSRTSISRCSPTPPCFQKTRVTPKRLCGAQSWHWQRGESWIGGKTILGWSLVCWRLLIMSSECVAEAPSGSQPCSVLLTWHYIVSCNVSYTCTSNLSNYRGVSDVFPSPPQPYHGLSVAAFFVATPPLMCVLTLSVSDGGRKHFSPMSSVLCSSQLPPPFRDRSLTFILVISTAGFFRGTEICAVQSRCRQKVQHLWRRNSGGRKSHFRSWLSQLKEYSAHIVCMEAGALSPDLTSVTFISTLAWSQSAFIRCLWCFETS